jgi:hypothetical protein
LVGPLGPGDYALDLFDASLDFESKSRFVGWRMSAEIAPAQCTLVADPRQ